MPDTTSTTKLATRELDGALTYVRGSIDTAKKLLEEAVDNDDEQYWIGAIEALSAVKEHLRERVVTLKDKE